MTDVFASLSRLYHWQSLLDVVLVTLVFYALFRLFRGTRAVQLVRGVLVVLLIFAILGQTIDLPAFNWLPSFDAASRNAGAMRQPRMSLATTRLSNPPHDKPMPK